MQLTTEIVVSWIGGAVSGATVAWLGNRVMNAELWGHLRKHCSEIETNTQRLNAHSKTLGGLGRRVAVLLDRTGVRTEENDDW